MSNVSVIVIVIVGHLLNSLSRFVCGNTNFSAVPDTMSSTPILPPFPFPEKWAEVGMQQRESGTKTWLVPSPAEIEELVRTYFPQDRYIVQDNVEQYIETSSVINQGELPAELRPSELDWNEDNGEEFETLELDPAWAARFSKTIKRMKQKVHKAKRRADWKKK